MDRLSPSAAAAARRQLGTADPLNLILSFRHTGRKVADVTRRRSGSAATHGGGVSRQLQDLAGVAHLSAFDFVDP